MPFYVDTSAAAKLTLHETHSAALSRWARKKGRTLVASDLLRTELLRAVRRLAPQHMARARQILDTLTLIAPAVATFERAAMIDPPLLRSLDALHVATALELGDDLEGFVTYDTGQAQAVKLLGIPVITPR